MEDDRALPDYAGHRFPPEVIGYAVGAYFRFPLSHRDVGELLVERGVTISHETIRRWCLKLGQVYMNALRPRCLRLGDKWHLDEMLYRQSATTPQGHEQVSGN